MNIALFVIPISIGRSREKLAAALLRWAETTQVRDLVIRVSGPSALPGKDYEVWLFETTSLVAELLLRDVSMNVRAAVLLRLKSEGVSFVRVVTRGQSTEEKTGSVEEMEVIAGHGLSAFEGSLVVEPGWLAPWVEAHTKAAQPHVVRWNHQRPLSSDWPLGYSKPEDDEWRFFDGLDDVREGRYRPSKE